MKEKILKDAKNHAQEARELGTTHVKVTLKSGETSTSLYHQPQSKTLFSPFNFHSLGKGLVSQSNGSPAGSLRAARAKDSRTTCFCSAPIASGWAAMKRGVPLPAINCIHCLFLLQGTHFGRPTHSPSPAYKC